MRKYIQYIPVISIMVVSCGRREMDLGDNFVLYKGDNRFPLSVGLDLGDGGIQGLLDGDIVEMGYNAEYITVKMRGGECYFLDKKRIRLNPADVNNRGEGPMMREEFDEISKVKGFPILEIIK